MLRPRCAHARSVNCAGTQLLHGTRKLLLFLDHTKPCGGAIVATLQNRFDESDEGAPIAIQY